MNEAKMPNLKDKIREQAEVKVEEVKKEVEDSEVEVEVKKGRRLNK